MKIQIPDFSQSKVLVVGDLMLDRYWTGPTSRISPEAPVPVVKVDAVEHKAGGAGNVALNIAALAGQVELLGYTGDDEAADSLSHCLQSKGVACRFERVSDNKTITKLRVLSRHQQLIRLDFEDGFEHIAPDALLERYRSLLASCQSIVLSDYGKGTLQDVPVMIAAAREAGIPVLVDPKGRDFSIYRGATLITPNQSEFEAVVGPCPDENALLAKGRKLLNDLQLDALLVTRSEKGMVLFSNVSQPVFVSTHAREVYDVTGAGDTVIAVMAASLACGETLEQATRLANLAAGIVVAKLGTATASVGELHKAMLKHEPLPRGVTDVKTLQQRLVKAKASGEKIVMTNGCFDILHAGHVAYLSKAAELADRLIVAVNDDNSVKRLKGDDRPVNPLMQRMVVLSALESVDWVVPFSEDTPVNLIETLAPDVLVKGGDYQVEQIAGADSVKANGGEVVVLEFIDGCSTSGIIESIQKRV